MEETIKVLEEFINSGVLYCALGNTADKAVAALLQAYKEDERVIEEMVKWINSNEDPFEGCHENDKCTEQNIPCKDCIENYFRNKVREENKE